MRSKLNIAIIFILNCLALFCPASEAPEPKDPNRYLNAIREFADNVLKYGRDTYWPKHTPLFVDGLNIHSHEPVKWIDPDGTRWILSNFASQQTLLRTLDGLTAITGDPKYRQAAMDAVRYEFDHVRTPSGLFYWGHMTAYDALGDTPRGNTSRESIKLHYPYYELMWTVDANATRNLIEALWCAHVVDWSNLDFNRTAPITTNLEEPWNHEYNEQGPTFFKSKSGGKGFFSTGTSLVQAGTALHKLSGQEQPLVWSRRLIRRFVDTRHPRTGISAYIYNSRLSLLGDGLKEHFADRYTTIFPVLPFEEGRGLYDSQNRQALTWISLLLVGDTLGEEGSEFTQWTLEELTAWGKEAYRKKDNAFIPILTDGTKIEGYVCKESSRDAPRGSVAKPFFADPTFFWAYSVAYRTTGDQFTWQMTRDIALGNDFGDIGESSIQMPSLQVDTNSTNVFGLLGFLELFRKTKNPPFREMARRIGDNIINNQFYEGFFVPSKKHIYTRFDCFEPLALLHLYTAIKPKTGSVPVVWSSSPLFVPAYRYKQEGVDRRIIYTLTESTEPPLSLQEAAAIGDVNMVRSLLEKGVGVDSWDDSLKKTALQRAAMSGNKDIVELLLAKGARLNAQEDFPGGTALDYAAENGNKEIAELLIAKGADVNAKRTGYPAGDTPLHSAIRGGHKDIVGLLIAKGANINIKNNNGQTPLDIAINRNRKDIVQLLMSKGATISSIHTAAFIGDINEVKTFVEDGSSADKAYASGQTPLHYATAGNHKAIAELLVSHGADVNTVAGTWRTPLGVAARTGSVDMAEFLIAHGANVDGREGHWTPLQEAAYYSKEIVELLLRHGANINVGGWSALHSALDAERFDIVELLLAKGADVNIKDGKGRTPLHIAAWYAAGKNTKIVDLLLSKGADINAKANNGKTALVYAVEGGYTEIIELLRKRMLSHNVAITNVLVSSTCVQGDTLPVTISVANKSVQRETFRITLVDTIGSVEIAGREMTLEPQKYRSAHAADKIFTGEPDTTSRLGQCVVLGKDINGDSYGDVFLGAPYYKNIQGRVYIYYGSSNPTFEVPDVTLTGESDNDYFGHDIVLADFNNDHHMDMAITAAGYNSLQGRVYIYYGGPDFDTIADKIFDGETGTAGRFGRNIAAGDINSDGCAELLVCADYFNSKKGRVYLYYGAPGKDMDTTCGLVFDGENPDDRLGISLALGQDIDGDGYGDLLIGSLFYKKGKNDGRAYLHWGTKGAGMDNISDLIFNNQSEREQFANSIELFDIDNDGRADILIGARAYNRYRGRVYLYWGSDRRNMDKAPDKYFTGVDVRSSLGGNIIDCGHANSDPYGDILVGGFAHDKGKGRAYLFYGNTKSETDTTCDYIFNGENRSDRFGSEVTLGDINGDNFAEVLIGARTFKSNSFQGRAYLYYGPFSDSEEITFNWDTTNASIGKHVLKVEIPPVAGEKNTEDNIKTVTIEVKEPSK